MNVHAQGAAGFLDVRPGSPEAYVRADDLAQLLGAALQEQADLLVLRDDDVTLTVFAGSDEALVADGRALETALSAPVVRDEDGWWLPLDAGTSFGLQRVGPDVVVGPEGRTWRLRFAASEPDADDPRVTLLRPAPGVVALELRDRSGPEDASQRAVWVGDLALVTLLAPELRGPVDEALRDAGPVRALLLVATSRAAGAAFDGISVAADGRTLVAEGARHETLVGSATAVAPDAPWIAVVWLPAGTRLDRPLRIGWEGASAAVTFRN